MVTSFFISAMIKMSTRTHASATSHGEGKCDMYADLLLGLAAGDKGSSVSRKSGSSLVGRSGGAGGRGREAFVAVLAAYLAPIVVGAARLAGTARSRLKKRLRFDVPCVLGAMAARAAEKCKRAAVCAAMAAGGFIAERAGALWLQLQPGGRLRGDIEVVLLDIHLLLLRLGVTTTDAMLREVYPVIKVAVQEHVTRLVDAAASMTKTLSWLTVETFHSLLLAVREQLAAREARVHMQADAARAARRATSSPVPSPPKGPPKRTRFGVMSMSSSSTTTMPSARKPTTPPPPTSPKGEPPRSDWWNMPRSPPAHTPGWKRRKMSPRAHHSKANHSPLGRASKAAPPTSRSSRYCAVYLRWLDRTLNELAQKYGEEDTVKFKFLAAAVHPDKVKKALIAANEVAHDDEAPELVRILMTEVFGLAQRATTVKQLRLGVKKIAKC